MTERQTATSTRNAGPAHDAVVTPAHAPVANTDQLPTPLREAALPSTSVSQDASTEAAPEARRGFIRSVVKVVSGTASVFRESFNFAYEAAPSLTKYRMGFAVAQAGQMLVYGALFRALSEGMKHASSVFHPAVLLPVGGAIAIKLFIDAAQSRSQNAIELQQANVDARVQEKIRSLSPQSLERLNQPKISFDHKLVSWGGIWGLTGASNHIIQGAGTAAALAISTGFIAAYSPLWVTGLVALSVLYPAYKTYKLAVRTTEHEFAMSEKRLRALESAWSRTWPNMARLLRVLGVQQEMDSRVESKRSEIVCAEKRLANEKNRYNDVGHLVNAAAGLTFGLSVLNEVIRGSLAIENALFVVTVALPIFQSSIETFTGGLLAIVRGRPVLEAMDRLTRAKKEECNDHGSQEIAWNHTAATIDIKDLHFAYPVKNAGGRLIPILRDVNLKIEPGSLVSIVGDNGAGKSTLMQLLDRSYQPISGSLHIDGCDIANVTDANLFRGMRALPQNVQMLSGFSVEEFISWGRKASGLPEDPQLLKKIMDSIGASELFDDEVELADGSKLKRFPNGIKTKMVAADGGVDFSGGEMAMLYIAYMLYSEPKILCLDEPEKALSQERQKKVYKTLFSIEELLGYKPTILLVTHNLDRAVESKDAKILFVDKKASGVGGFGTHQELMASCADYADWFTRSTAKS